jgi:hypothetical protein
VRSEEKERPVISTDREDARRVTANRPVRGKTTIDKMIPFVDTPSTIGAGSRGTTGA